MKLETERHSGPRKPLRTVSEIADMLGIAITQLSWALKRDGAPRPVFRGIEAHHHTGKGRVWYEPGAVIRWWREYEATDPAKHRREYHREYSRMRREGP